MSVSIELTRARRSVGKGLIHFSKAVVSPPEKKPAFDAAAQWARLALPPISPTRQLSSSLPTIACNLSAERRREHCAHATIHKPVAWRIATCARGEPCAQLLPGRALRCAGRGRNAGFLFCRNEHLRATWQDVYQAAIWDSIRYGKEPVAIIRMLGGFPKPSGVQPQGCTWD